MSGMSDERMLEAVRIAAFEEGYEFGRAEMKQQMMSRGVAGAPLGKSGRRRRSEEFWKFHISKGEDGAYE